MPARVAGREESSPAPEGGERKPLAVEARGRWLGDSYMVAEVNCDPGARGVIEGLEASEEGTPLSTTPSMLGLSLFRRADGGDGGSAELSDRPEAERCLALVMLGAHCSCTSGRSGCVRMSVLDRLSKSDQDRIGSD